MLLILLIVLLCFTFVVIIGAPYLPTFKDQQTLALNMLDLKKSQAVLDIGSGDGRFLRAAAKRGLIAYGIEANPILVLISYIVTWRYRKLVHIKWGNMWQTDWPEVQGIYAFLHTRFMHKLDTKLVSEYTSNGKHVLLASYAFTIPNKKPIKELGALFLYKY